MSPGMVPLEPVYEDVFTPQNEPRPGFPKWAIDAARAAHFTVGLRWDRNCEVDDETGEITWLDGGEWAIILHREEVKSFGVQYLQMDVPVTSRVYPELWTRVLQLAQSEWDRIADEQMREHSA